MPRQFATPCLVCGTLTRQGNRCEIHQAEMNQAIRKRLDGLPKRPDKRDKYGGSYKSRAKAVKQYALDNNLPCPLCGQPLTVGGIIHADHVYPAMGQASPLQAVHAKCNLSKGNRPPGTSIP